MGIKTKSGFSAYKDSGVEWLGKVPNHWGVLRIKHCAYVKGRIGWHGLNSDEFIDDGPFLVTGTDFLNGQVNWATCYHVDETRYLQDPYITLQNGDLLITKDGTIGKLAIVENMPDKATLNSGIFIVRALRSTFLAKYLFWILSSGVFSTFINFTKSGTTINHLYQEAFVNFAFPIPPLHEQRAIAHFLDRETTRIDALIAKYQRLIELLDEKRTSLISQAVTKGLDASVEMKESGVEWLGNVPCHWEVTKLKHVVTKIGSGKTPRGGSEIYTNEGVIFIRSQNVHFDGLHLDDVVYIDCEIDKEMHSTRVQENDVLLNITGASLGRATIVPKSLQDANVNQHVAIIRPKTIFIIPQFLNAIIGSNVVQAQIFSTENGAAREGLPYSKTANLIFALPVSLDEQKTIAEYIDQQMGQLSTLVTMNKTIIERLQEYRTALISAAVTGKIQVT